jgi:hypothetical protein
VIVVVGIMFRCRWVGGVWWGVVWVIAWRGFRAVLRVDEPVIVAVGGLSE